MEELHSLYTHWKLELDKSLTDPSLSEKAIHILQVIITAITACDYAKNNSRERVTFSYWNKDKREQMDYYVYVWGRRYDCSKSVRTRSCRAIFECDCESIIPKYGFCDAEYPESTFELYALRRVKEVIHEVTTTQKRRWCDYPAFCSDSTDDDERRGKSKLDRRR